MKAPFPARADARRLAALAMLTIAVGAGDALAQRWADDDIRKQIVEDSIARFGGDCPCPYSYAWNGRQCAGDSAYMKRLPGAPYCYLQDVPPHEVYRWRHERGL